MKTLHAIVSVLVLTTFSAAYAQQPVAPTPKPDKVPSLTETMQLLQKILRDKGKLTYVSHTHNDAGGDTATQQTSEISNVVADPAACTISYHYKKTALGNVMENDYSLNLHDVHSVVVITFEKYAREEYEREKPYIGEKSGWYAKFDPPIFLVFARGPGDKEQGFDFADESMARRIAKELTHAVYLCGGGSKEPLKPETAP